MRIWTRHLFESFTLRAADMRRVLWCAVGSVMAGEFQRAFARSGRPAMRRGEAMGFCFYNNAAIAVLHALDQHGLARVALIDFDVRPP
jgi:acetoin utilization deacetylase AcuC-like enzyme